MLIRKKIQFVEFTLNTRTHQFHSNFTSKHQLTCQTYIIHNYNCKDRIKIVEIPQNKPQFDPLRIPTYVHSNLNCDKLIPYL